MAFVDGEILTDKVAVEPVVSSLERPAKTGNYTAIPLGHIALQAGLIDAEDMLPLPHYERGARTE